jgi:FKBP-type peptidyl-prolyl cis-trans isomerase 2
VIQDGKKVSIEYTLNLDDGTLVGSNVGEDPLVYEHGRGQILPALERALAGLEQDATKEVKLTAEEGYGQRDPSAFKTVETEAIPEDARKVGTVLAAQDESGNQQHVRVHEIREDGIVLDLNHLLAGENLNFKVRVLTIE